MKRERLSEAAVARIVAAVGEVPELAGREAIARLDEVRFLAEGDHRKEINIARAALKGDEKDALQHVEGLLEILSGDDAKALIWGLKARKGKVDLVTLAQELRNLRALIESRLDGRTRRRRPETSLQILLRSTLPSTYETAFARKPKVSRPNGGGPPYGDYIRFALAAGEELGISFNADTVAEGLRFWRKTPKLP